MNDKKYDSIAAMLSDVSDDSKLIADVQQTSSERELIKHLIAHRVKSDMSQNGIAKFACFEVPINLLKLVSDAV